MLYGIITQEQDEEVLVAKASRFGLSVFSFGDDSNRGLSVGFGVTPQQDTYQLEIPTLPEVVRLKTERSLLDFQKAFGLDEPIRYYILVGRF